VRLSGHGPAVNAIAIIGLYLRHMRREEILNSLLLVGPRKAVGYLPLNTIRKVLHMDLQSLVREATAKGLSAVVLEPDRCCIKSGALYVYDSGSLLDVLEASRIVLSKHGWPTDADGFIIRVASEWLEEASPIYPVIRQAFGEA
jgi:hypothetical protein